MRYRTSSFKLRSPGDITVDASRPFLALAEQHSLIIPGLGCDTGAKRKKAGYALVRCGKRDRRPYISPSRHTLDIGPDLICT